MFSPVPLLFGVLTEFLGRYSTATLLFYGQEMSTFPLFALCFPTVLPHFNIFQPLIFVCVLYAFCLPFSLQKTHKKIALPCMVGIGEVCGITFLQHSPSGGIYKRPGLLLALSVICGGSRGAYRASFPFFLFSSTKDTLGLFFARIAL